MVEKDLIGRYEGNHTGTPQYAIIKHLQDETYRVSYGAIGFEPTSSKTIDGNDALREAVGNMAAAGYQKMPDDTDVLITERPNQEFVGLRDWLSVGGGS